MDKKEIFNRIEYVVACVGAFAQRYQLSIDDAVSDLQVICQREGGKI